MENNDLTEENKTKQKKNTTNREHKCFCFQIHSLLAIYTILLLFIQLNVGGFD